MLHKLAKQILDQRLELVLPEIAVGNDVDRIVASAGGNFTFDRAEVEVPFEGFQPDVVLYRGARRLLVEVLVTHASDPLKIERIAAAGLSAVEIDLSALPRGTGPDVIAEALCRSAPRWWIANPRIDEARADLEARRAVRAQREAEVREQARQQAERRAARLADEVSTALASPRPSRPATAFDHRVREAGLASFIGRAIPGDSCFAVPAAVWQAAVLADVVLSQVGRDAWHQQGRHPSETFKAARLAKMLKPGVPSFIDAEAASALRERIGFSTPFEVMSAYLSDLATRRLIVERRKRWFVTDAAWSHVGDTLEAHERRRTRKAQLITTIEHIVRSLPHREQEGFHLDAWLDTSVLDGDLSPNDALGRQEEGAALVAAAAKLKLMLLAGGPLCSDLLGLPLSKACARERASRDHRAAEAQVAEQTRVAVAAAKAAAQAALDAAARVAALRSEVSRGLGRDDAAWLTGAIGAVEQTPEQLAASGDAGYQEARGILADLIKERERRTRTDRLREALRNKARQSARPDRGHVFLHSGQPRLRGMRPIDYCVDETSFAMVASMLDEIFKR